MHDCYEYTKDICIPLIAIGVNAIVAILLLKTLNETRKANKYSLKVLSITQKESSIKILNSLASEVKDQFETISNGPNHEKVNPQGIVLGKIKYIFKNVLQPEDQLIKEGARKAENEPLDYIEDWIKQIKNYPPDDSSYFHEKFFETLYQYAILYKTFQDDFGQDAPELVMFKSIISKDMIYCVAFFLLLNEINQIEVSRDYIRIYDYLMPNIKDYTKGYDMATLISRNAKSP